MVFGYPVAPEAEPVGVAGKIETVANACAPVVPVVTGERSSTERGVGTLVFLPALRGPNIDKLLVPAG